ncbi:MAG TPA: alpha/beta fold hydrolase [Polyangiaceae bacterium]|nr:alpha/beta fold hydrolase [Polyangiaceae bacterium]
MGDGDVREARQLVELRSGDGVSAPIVAIHGFLGSPAAFRDVAALVRHPGRFSAMRLPGHGPEPWGLELESFDDAVTAIAEALPDHATHLLGYSMGGRIALALAERFPERTLSVTAVGAHSGLADEAARSARRRIDLGWAAELRTGGVASFVDAWERMPLFATQSRLPDDARATQRAARLSHTAEGLARALEILGTGGMLPRDEGLRHLRVPVRLAVGGLDADYLTHARTLARSSPFFEVWVVGGAGHNLALEAPAALARIVDELARSSTPRAASRRQP